MALHVYVFLLVVCLLFSLALFWRLDWFHFRPSPSAVASRRSPVHRSLCPAAQMIVPPVDSPPLPRRVRSQRLGLCGPGARSKAAEVPPNG
jgi:hypothetical protein